MRSLIETERTIEKRPGASLAINGGEPVRKRPWTDWPIFSESTEKAILDCLRSRRWTISWRSDGSSSLERRFADAWAKYNGVPHCVSVDHGSSALLVALEALDIGPGDEVIIPTMTWVAPATAVLRVGALPVLADVDSSTGCITPETLEAAISDRTRAVIVVHLGCTVADIDAILSTTEKACIEVIEDCAQAHGARWRNRAVGTFGRVGIFSFQNGKVLASGEGGAAITSDENLFYRLQELRSDSRRYPLQPVAVGEEELTKGGNVMGANYCMPEFCAAVLLDRLPHLDEEHHARDLAAKEIESALADSNFFTTIPVPQEVTKRSIFRFGIQYEPETFGNAPIDRVAKAISAELGLSVVSPDRPLHRSSLFRPQTKRRFAPAWSEDGSRRSVDREFTGAEWFAASTLMFHHAALLGGKIGGTNNGQDVAADAEDIATALEKVRRAQDEL